MPSGDIPVGSEFTMALSLKISAQTTLLCRRSHSGWRIFFGELCGIGAASDADRQRDGEGVIKVNMSVPGQYFDHKIYF